MIRGTTPTFKLILSDETVDLTAADNVYATFEQRGNTLTKTGADLEITAQEVDVYLTQAETLSFYRGPLEIQLNWTYDGGERACSTIARISIGDNLLPEVLS